MTIWLAIFYGALQGVAEFLPISSSGHLVLFNKILGTSENFVFFSVLLHFATLLAVVVVMWKEIKFLIKQPFSKIAKKLYVATIPTVLIVFIFEGLFKNAFGGNLLPICFIITAILLFITEILSQRISNKQITYKSCLIIGIMQGIAVLPGISRSGTTICTAMLCGVDKEKATKFSFLLSIPIIIGSMLFEIFDVFVFGSNVANVDVLPSVISFLVAFGVGVLSLKFMLKIFKKIKLWWFSIYLIVIGIISLLVL